MSLPPHLKKEVECLGHVRGCAVTFTEIMQHFNALFTRNRATALRRKLRELALPKSGKITAQILRNFEIDFRECVRELLQLSRDEQGERLRSKLIDYMSAWVIEREKESDRCTPILHLRFPVHAYSITQVREAVQSLSGAHLKEISALEVGFFEIHCHNMGDAKEIGNLNGKCIVGNPAPIMVMTKETSLGVNEIFEVLKEKVERKKSGGGECIQNSGGTTGEACDHTETARPR